MPAIEFRRMDAAAVKPHIDEMRSNRSSRSGKIAMAKLALKFANLTPCAREAWEGYLAELGAE